MQMPMAGMPGMQQEGTNLLEILINLAFGFVAGLVIFLGFQTVIAYGSKLAGELLKMTPQGQMMASFGGATNYASYIVIAPLSAMVLKQLAAVRSLKSFAYFAAAIVVGIAIAFVAKGYVVAMMAR